MEIEDEIIDISKIYLNIVHFQIVWFREYKYEQKICLLITRAMWKYLKGYANKITMNFGYIFSTKFYLGNEETKKQDDTEIFVRFLTYTMEMITIALS